MRPRRQLEVGRLLWKNRRTMRKRRLGSIRHPETQEDLSAASLLVSSASSAVPPLSMWTAGDYAGGLFGSVVTSGAVTVDSCYVGAHTSSGKLLITPLPDKKEFDGLSGRYNIVSRATRAGGLAAVMPGEQQDLPFLCDCFLILRAGGKPGS